MMAPGTLSRAERACAVGAAAAHDFNNELTIIVNGLDCLLEAFAENHPARPMLIELQQAAQRCVWKASGLLNYSAKRGIRPVCCSMEKLILESQV